MKQGHSEPRMQHKPRQNHSHEAEMARMEKAKKGFGPMDGGGKSEQAQMPQTAAEPSGY